ncbi:hypothetical protein CEXT_580161 [Caerostris extrusa]|uniref:Uncharacterized protein n=1 Tax=Caerostris extrusa TaxID=172846 RepID=A0AAV4RE35_CAEEX|nr:hypothetical protein CEXT_580161 [Caerostris extrusa]
MKKTALIHKRPSACLLYSISAGTSGLEIPWRENKRSKRYRALRGWGRSGWTAHPVHVSDGEKAICGSPRREIFHKTSPDPAHARLRTPPPRTKTLRHLSCGPESVHPSLPLPFVCY